MEALEAAKHSLVTFDSVINSLDLKDKDQVTSFHILQNRLSKMFEAKVKSEDYKKVLSQFIADGNIKPIDGYTVVSSPFKTVYEADESNKVYKALESIQKKVAELFKPIFEEFNKAKATYDTDFDTGETKVIDPTINLVDTLMALETLIEDTTRLHDEIIALGSSIYSFKETAKIPTNVVKVVKVPKVK